MQLWQILNHAGKWMGESIVINCSTNKQLTMDHSTPLSGQKTPIGSDLKLKENCGEKEKIGVN